MTDGASSVGFIGLGSMGSPMASRLGDWSGGLTVFDVRADAASALAERGAKVAGSPREVAEASDVISVMVLDDAQVREVLAGGDGVLAGARPGRVVAIHSTIAPGTAESLAEDAGTMGVAVVDAPVSGGFVGAHEGTLAVLVGGDDAAVERCRGPFGRWANLFVHVGPVGAGTRAKLARNLVTMVSFAAAAEAQRLAEAAGIDLAALGRVVRHSDAVTGGPGAIMLRDSTALLAPGDDWYDAMVHTRTLGEKDLRLVLDLAADLGVALPLAEEALTRLADALGVPHSGREGAPTSKAAASANEQAGGNTP
ncbi:MAG TPA: NAD(P)-dependent oxidoreductase [Acidimicrobiia bacterium]|nr:NAD(P)-dependent oxidoreductase [Acidimicrobiia bacterium]